MSESSELRAHHVGITVVDLDRMVDFYRDIFDLSVLARFSVGGDAFETGVDIEGASARFAHLAAGDLRLELVEYNPKGEARSTPTLNRPGATHLGLRVDTLDAFYETLPATVETLSAPQTTETGTKILFCRDPEANLVEVLER